MKAFLFSEQWYWLIIMALLSYLLGGLSGAVFISKNVKHEDIREKGSGNPGTMNMARAYGFMFGFYTFLFDMIKGALPTLIGLLVYKNYTIADSVNAGDFVGYLNGLFVVLGHIYPALKKFKGGKGIATTFGVFTVGLVRQTPWFLLIIPVCYILLLALLYVIEYGSVVSLVGITTFGVVQALFFMFDYGTPSLALGGLYGFIFLICALDWFAHRSNLRKLFSGEEHRTSLKAMLKKKKK